MTEQSNDFWGQSARKLALTAPWRRTAGLNKPLRELALTGFVMLAAVEAVVNDDAVIVDGIAPALCQRVLAQIVGGINVVASHSPWERILRFRPSLIWALAHMASSGSRRRMLPQTRQCRQSELGVIRRGERTRRRRFGALSLPGLRAGVPG